MVEVTAVRMVGGREHQHIAEVRWRELASNDTGVSTRSQMVEWLRLPGSRAVVSRGGAAAEVGVVDAHPPYIRTYADSQWSNNLLALPHF